MLKNSNPSNFDTMLQAEVPRTRNGKHRNVITKILNDLSHLEEGRAMKIPLESLADSKENVRSALNRETHKRGMNVSTASDDSFLYVWQENGNGHND